MLKDILTSRLVQGALACLVLILVGYTLYLKHVETETRLGEERTAEKVNRLLGEPQEVSDAAVENSSQGGHWHGDAWHAKPHAAVEVSEAAVSDVERGAPVSAQQADTQISAPMQAASDADTQTDPEAYAAWVAWENKRFELAKEYSRVSKELSDAMPSTEAEQERYDTDENFKRAVERKMSTAFENINDVQRRMRAHDEKRIFPPQLTGRHTSKDLK